jgi:PTH1 family peptidyl-tRNA hydrolase
VIVIYDELDLPLGTIRIRERGSANGHNGAISVSGALGTDEWLRIRIGVGKPPLADGREIKSGGTDYLLSRCASRSLRCWMKCSTGFAARSRRYSPRGGPAMSEFNRSEL